MEMSERKGREGEIRTSQTRKTERRGRRRDNGELEQGVEDEERERGKRVAGCPTLKQR